MTMTKSLRKRMAVACFDARVEAAACSGEGNEVAACSGSGSRTAGGGGGVVDSRAIVERERARGQTFAKCGEGEREVKNLLSVARESAGLKFLFVLFN
jgi:hypothetical protein